MVRTGFQNEAHHSENVLIRPLFCLESGLLLEKDDTLEFSDNLLLRETSEEGNAVIISASNIWQSADIRQHLAEG